MSGYNAGTIHYIVQADTQRLIDAARKANEAIDSTGNAIKKSGDTAQSAEPKMKKLSAEIRGMGNSASTAGTLVNSLTKYLGALLTLGAAKSLIEMSESYNEMADRIQLATNSTEEYTYVQERMLKTANATERALAESQELYLGISGTLKDMGYETSAVIDIGDSLSHSFAANATNAQKADAAINAFSKAMAKGRVDAMQWISITSAAPTIVNDIAKASGKATSEIRRLGAEGKIGARELADGLQQALEKNRELDASMGTTLAGSLLKVKNSLSQYIGELNRSSGAMQVVNGAISQFAEHIDTAANIALVAGSAALGRYVTLLGVSTIASMKAAHQTRIETAEKLRLAKANHAASAEALKHALANKTLGDSHAEAARLTKLHEVNTRALTAAQTGLVTVGRTLAGVLGGPAGIIALVGSAAAAFVLLGRNSKSAKYDIDDLTDAEIRNERNDIARSIDGAAEAAERAEAKYKNLKHTVDAYREAEEKTGEKFLSDGLIERLDAAEAGYDRNSKALEKLVAREKALNDEINSRSVAGPKPQARDVEADRYIKNKQDELELLKLEGEARVKLQAIQRAGDNATPEQVKEAQDIELQIYRIEEARKKLAGTTKLNTKESDELTKAENQNKAVIAELEQQLRFAALAGYELAEAKALAGLNSTASPDEIERVKALARAVEDVAAAERDRATLHEFDAIEGEKAKHEDALSRLKELNEKKLMEDERYFELKSQLEREHVEQMQLLEEERFAKQSWANEMMIKGLNNLEQAAGEAMTNLFTGASNSTEAIQALAAGISQELISSIVKMGVSQVKAWAMGQVAQKTAAAGYVTSVSGQVAANTALAAQAAFASTAAIPIFGPEAAPAAAAAAGAAAQALGTPAIAASALVQGGGRFYGGPVSAGKGYRINENGAPEILNTASGQQYLLPNSRGQVVSNKDARGGGQVIVNISISSSGGVDVNASPADWGQRGQEIGKAVKSIVQEELQRAMQPGGTIRGGLY